MSRSWIRRSSFTVVADWICIFLATIVSGLLVLIGGSPWLHVVGLLTLMTAAAAVARGDLLHPYTWYVPMFALYAISVPILVALGELNDFGTVRTIASLEWAALVTLIVTIGPRRYPLTLRQAPVKQVGWQVVWLVLLAATVVTVPYLWRVATGGFDSKFAILLSDSPLLRLSPAFSIQAFAFALLAAAWSNRVKRWWILVVSVMVWVTVAFLITGERDYFLRVLWISVFTYHAFRRALKPTVIAAAGMICALSLPLLGDLKNALITSDVVRVSTDNILLRTLSDEFITSGRNLVVLISQSDQWRPFHGETVLWAFWRTVVPDALFPGVGGPTATSWFNNLFYSSLVSQGGGVGFSMIGEGYINFGTPGVVLWFCLIGLFLRRLYRASQRGTYEMVMYVVTMPIALYVIRADLAGMASQFAKHVVLPLLVVKLLSAAGNRTRNPVRFRLRSRRMPDRDWRFAIGSAPDARRYVDWRSLTSRRNLRTHGLQMGQRQRWHASK